MDLVLNDLLENPAEWVMVLMTIVTSGVGLLIAHRVRESTKVTERLQGAQSIYEQWTKKKELSITVPAITRLDAAVYTPEAAPSLEQQQQKIWIVLIIDIMFNCYIAMKSGNYPKEVFEEDMKVHIGSLARHDPDLLEEAMVERGYLGEGSLGEYYELLSGSITTAREERSKQGKITNLSANYILLDVFAEDAFQGNPLAVFPDAIQIDPSRLQAIAGELNLSETVFLFPTNDPAIVEVRIFTPRNEIPFAGHPSIGAAHCVLTNLESASSVSLQMAAGTVVVIQDQDIYLMTPPQLPSRLEHPFSNDDFAKMLGLQANNIVNVHSFTAGLPFLLVELPSAALVDQAELSNADWAATIGDSEVKDIYLFAIDSSTPEPTVYSRLFAPADNIGEDPATGSAAAALSGLLRERDISGDIMVFQGYKMGRPSQILIRIGENKVQVGGRVTCIGQGSILVPRSDSIA